MLIVSQPSESGTAPPGKNSSSSPDGAVASKPAVNFSYRIVNIFPHDTSSFTQGLVMDNGDLYEGTGIRGRSSLKKIRLETGEVLKTYNLPSQFFGEGVTITGDKIIQLTWKSRIGFIFDKKNLGLLKTFRYYTEGWGITHDGTHLIMSNGTSKLLFLDPVSFIEIRSITVNDADGPVTNLNELEYIKGEIFANVWRSNSIAVISPDTGRVTGWIHLDGIARLAGGDMVVKTLNGIAYDAKNDRLLVTGKLWPNIYEIKLTPAH